MDAKNGIEAHKEEEIEDFGKECEGNNRYNRIRGHEDKADVCVCVCVCVCVT